MTASQATTKSTSSHLAAPRPSRGRLIAAWLLDAALATQPAAWIAVVLTRRDIGSAFTQPHPGFKPELVTGSGIWLIQFAPAVILFHRKARAA